MVLAPDLQLPTISKRQLTNRPPNQTRNGLPTEPNRRPPPPHHAAEPAVVVDLRPDLIDRAVLHKPLVQGCIIDVRAQVLFWAVD
jgi:hypothetical protein